jgi:NADPH:quinone reductase-like Zn-dependent oxidoreductase
MKILEAVSAIKNRVTKKTMHAVRMHSYGGPDVLTYEEIDRPVPQAGEILVKVHAAGVNPVDWKIREGYLKEMHSYNLPLIPGWDFSGEVESIGEGANGFQKGDEVFGRPDLARNGAYAEYVIVHENELAFKPRTIDHIQAAAIPLAALTAWQALFDAAALKPGQRVLIHAAAGGVGHFAVQLTKWRGAYMIGTASSRNQEFVSEMGADEVIDYQATKFEDVVDNVDVVLDTIGNDAQERSWKVLKKGGILVSIVKPPSQQTAEENGVRQAFVFVKTIATQLNEIAELADSGELNAFVETVLPLSEARKAQELSRSGHTRGKLVLRVI